MDTTTPWQTPFCRHFSLPYPVMLAPMAGVSGGALAAAVSRAGGLGLIGGGYGDAAWLAEQLGICNSLLEGEPFGVGFISWALQRQPELVDLALEAGACAIFLSFGAIDALPGLNDKIHRAGATLIAQVQTVEQTHAALAAGVDVIVAQGSEAGGHSGQRGTLALVPAVVDTVDAATVKGENKKSHRPCVLAAGGIADGRGLAAALMLGADGVLCGTAFYAAEESLAVCQAKKILVRACGDDTIKSPVFDVLRGLDWPDNGRDAWQLRTLRNPFVSRWADDLPGLRASLSEQQANYQQALAKADFTLAPVIAGEAADLVQKIAPAADILHHIVTQARHQLEAAATFHPHQTR